MSHWEPNTGASDEWYTPRYIFDALGETFDLDVAAPKAGPRHVPADRWLHELSLITHWHGFVWMNPPFGGRGEKMPWVQKFFDHCNGIALLPDRTSAQWFQAAAKRADALLLVAPKVKFERPDGTRGEHPSTGTTLFAAGERAVRALERAQCLGLVVKPIR